MEWYWALIINLTGIILFVMTMLLMYKWTEHCEKDNKTEYEKWLETTKNKNDIDKWKYYK